MDLGAPSSARSISLLPFYFLHTVSSPYVYVAAVYVYHTRSTNSCPRRKFNKIIRVRGLLVVHTISRPTYSVQSLSTHGAFSLFAENPQPRGTRQAHGVVTRTDGPRLRLFTTKRTHTHIFSSLVWVC